MRGALAIGLVAAVGLSGTVHADGWDRAVRHARAYARTRAGSVSFVVIDGTGRMHGYRPHAGWYSASLLKPVILGTYLTRPWVRYRMLTGGERRLMEPMIRASSDGPASTLFVRLGRATIQRWGRAHGLTSLGVVAPTWGSTHITAAGYGRFFAGLPEAIGLRHRRFARRLLRSIIPSQRWGIAPVRPPGWTLLFKGGWRAGRGYGRIVNQAARLECGPRRIVLTILTDRDPSHSYGTHTITGVARRLLAPIRAGRRPRCRP